MSLHELLIRAAARHPSRLAVVTPAGGTSYTELDRIANVLAHRLRELGVGRGDRVIVWDDKSMRMVAAMQAVLRLGGGYVPADGSIPPGRIAAMAHDCGASVVCADGSRLASLYGAVAPGAGFLDLATPPKGPAAPVSETVAPDDLAYILYTSGSTGTPKGVCISHQNARAFVDWAVSMLTPQPHDRFANHAPLTFDLSVLDLYAAFSAGASVHLIPAELSYAPGQLVEFLYQAEISIWYSVPSALTLMMSEGGLLDRPPPEALRALLFAGEPFPIAGVRQLAGWTRARLLNLYGPTETNVCTFHEVTPGDLRRDRPVPIGEATCGDKVWAERPDGTVAGYGEEGELVVDGPTVMLGYWGHGRQPRPYRTGDVVRVLGDGSFDYLGRRDHMVKVRGHRIELAEVEAALAAHPGVAEVAVIATGAGVTGRLAAFVVARPGHQPSVLALKRHVAERLPRYMIVDDIRLLPRLPRTRTGKTDRLALASRGVAQPGSHRRLS